MQQTVPDDVVEVVFSIECRTLPVDHAYALSECIREVLPWFSDEPKAGMHTIHVAESANGWFRPDGPDQVLYPSRRSKFVLRLPKLKQDQVKVLLGQTLLVDGHKLTLTKSSVRKLSDLTTLFARYVIGRDDETESAFLERSVAELKPLMIRPRKMLCGTLKTFMLPEGPKSTRSLMLADLSIDESVALQEHGLGSHRHMGCGLFIPHKEINQISEGLG